MAQEHTGRIETFDVYRFVIWGVADGRRYWAAEKQGGWISAGNRYLLRDDKFVLDLLTDRTVPIRNGTPEGRQLAGMSADGKTLAFVGPGSGAAIETARPLSVYLTPAPVLPQPDDFAGRDVPPIDLDFTWSGVVADNLFRRERSAKILAAHPGQALEMAREKLKPVPVADRERVAELIVKLDDDSVDVRDKATADLQRVAHRFEPMLAKALKDAKPGEVKNRLTAVTKKMKESNSPAEFGNQIRGMIPPVGRRIRVRRMRSGGGSAGNLPAGTLNSISAKDAKGAAVNAKIVVLQPVATTGGSDAETTAAAERRIPARLRHRDRAVTAEDYRSLAREIPGGGVERVEVLPLFKPQTRTENVPGVVSVMVLPSKDTFQPPCPRADRPMLETVYAYLSPRKPVAAEMYVIGVDYVGIGISVAVEVRAGFEPRQVSNAIEQALRRYLWPLEPGGAAQLGWPLGRHVRSFELDVVVSQVPGVVEVNGLNLFKRRADGGYDLTGLNENAQQEITLHSYQLPELFDVIVAAGPDGSGVTAAGTLAPAPETDDSVAVPVVPKVC